MLITELLHFLSDLCCSHALPPCIHALLTEVKCCRLGSPTTSFHAARLCGDIHNALHKCTTRTPRCRYRNQMHTQSFPGSHINLCTTGHRQYDAFITHSLWCAVEALVADRCNNHIHIPTARAEDWRRRWREKPDNSPTASSEQAAAGDRLHQADSSISV